MTDSRTRHSMIAAIVLALFALSACGQEDATPNQDTVAVDGDGDGFTRGAGDCDDDDPAVHPGAPR